MAEVRKICGILLVLQFAATYTHSCSDGHDCETKIVNGDVAPDTRFQYQVSVQSTLDNYHLCSGVVLSEDYILTTAVCCTQDDVFLLKVVAGRHDLTDLETGVEVELESVIPHEDFDSFNLYDNICLMKLSTSLSLGGESGQVQVSTLPLSGQNFSGDATVSGWGTTSPADSLGSDVLLYATVPLVTDEDCLSILGITIQPQTMICAGGGETDACDRDQGGPLTCENPDGSDVVCGLVSFGLGECATPGFPGVYTEVSAYNEWIDEILSDEEEAGARIMRQSH